MDVDIPAVEETGDLIQYFAVREGEFAWTEDVVEQIRARRGAMSGELFFDILLKLGGIEDPASLYPPEDASALRRLVEAIGSASYDMMKRDCLVYYLLRYQMDGRENSFADERVISPHYVALADAYWHFDSNTNLGMAIGLLADARIVKDYTSKIIDTLALAPESGHLIRRFVRLCKPALQEEHDLERYLIATAELSLVEAWQYQKTFSDNDSLRRTLIHGLLAWAFSPTPRQQALTQLLAVPFTKFEESVIQGFAKNPPESLPPSSVSVVRDMVCVRLILSCKYIEAVKFDRQYPSSGAAAKGTWGAERQRIIADVLSIMPAAERALLEEELDGLPSSSSAQSKISSGSAGSYGNLTASTASIGTDLSMSWEDLGRRASQSSLGGRAIPSRTSRQSLSNGFADQPNLFTPGASTSTPRASQPLAAHPTVLNQGASMPSTGVPAATLSSSLFGPAGKSSTPTMQPVQRPSPVVPQAPIIPKVIVNGNGVSSTPKTNAFLTRNAFFNPPESKEQEPEPEAVRVNGKTNKAVEPTAKRPQPQSENRLPTPPQDEPEPEQAPPPTTLSEGGHADDVGDASQSVDGDADDRSVVSEREDLGYSIFGGSMPAKQRSPPKPTPPKRTRKTRSTSAGISVPGAFVSDEESTQDLLSPKAATRTTPAHEESISANTRRTSANKNTRKRAISPETSVENIKLSIPGTLYEEDEHEQSYDRSREHEHDDEERGEEVDELAPLPTSAGRARRKTTGTVQPKRRSSRATSRASSVEPDEGVAPGVVRRSSRLSTASSTGGIKEKEEKAEKVEKAAKKETRPRKSTRTAGAGATATGKGAAKRK